MTLAIIVGYLLAVLAIGLASRSMSQGTGEDWFVAARTIGPFMLLLTLFGTHMTAFSMLGASGEGYRVGIGVFGLMASSSALVVPAVFWIIGTRLWALGKRHGYMTQVQFLRARWGSDLLGLLMFVVLVALLIPYILIGVLGAGLTVVDMTDGAVPAWSGSLAACVVVLLYVTWGGMRGTTWANTFHTIVFMTLGALTFFWIVRSLGGFEAALQRVADNSPGLLVRGERVRPLEHLSYLCIPLSVGMFPHIFAHWLTARDKRSFRMPVVGYPICVALVWLPSVLLGVLGSADIPGLSGPAANSILVLMIKGHAPDLLAGLLAAGVLAAIMGSLDSQVLSLGTMFSQDIVRHYGFGDRMTERGQVAAGQLFVVGILLVTWLASLVVTPSIFALGIWSFTGFTGLFPVVVAALFWRRSTAAGVVASIVSVVVLWAVFFVKASGVPNYSVGGTGLVPAAVILLVSSVVLVAVSLVTRPPAEAVVARFFAPQERR